MNWKTPATEFARGLRDVFFPPVCVHCGALPEGSPLPHVCPTCVAMLARVGPPCCTCCGHPFYGEAAGERLCPHCEGLRPEFGEGRTAVLFKGAARDLVITLKYHHGLHVLRDIEAVFRASGHVLAFARDAVLVPVPLHPRKLRERGYNQAELIARCLARAAGGATRVEPLLVRVRDTETQTHFDRATRRANLKNAFAPAPGAALIAGQRYLLVDDVFTTGSTLNSCAAALRHARGAGGLIPDVVTFGHG